MDSKQILSILIFMMVISPARAQVTCIENYLSAKPIPSIDIQPKDVTELLSRIAESIGLTLDGITIVACDGETQVHEYFYQNSNEIPTGDYIIYDPIWLRQVVGMDINDIKTKARDEAVFLFGHEFAHALMRHKIRNVAPLKAEMEADYFGGCAAVMMGAKWENVADLIQRIRGAADSDHPSRERTLAIVKTGFEYCRDHKGPGPSTAENAEEALQNMKTPHAPALSDIWVPVEAGSVWEAGLTAVILRYNEKTGKPYQEYDVLWLYQNLSKTGQNLIEFQKNTLDGRPSEIELEARQVSADEIKTALSSLNQPNTNTADQITSSLRTVINDFSSYSPTPFGRYIGRTRYVYGDDPKNRSLNENLSFSRGATSISEDFSFRVGEMEKSVEPQGWVAVTARITLFAGDDDIKKEGFVGTRAF